MVSAGRSTVKGNPVQLAILALLLNEIEKTGLRKKGIREKIFLNPAKNSKNPNKLGRNKGSLTRSILEADFALK
jgi:hypothetical protein